MFFKTNRTEELPIILKKRKQCQTRQHSPNIMLMGAPTRVYSSFVPARSVKQNHQHAKSVFEYGCTTGKILFVRASVASTFVAINSRFGNVLFPANRFLKMGHAITRQLPMQYISCTSCNEENWGSTTSY